MKLKWKGLKGTKQEEQIHESRKEQREQYTHQEGEEEQLHETKEEQREYTRKEGDV